MASDNGLDAAGLRQRVSQHPDMPRRAGDVDAARDAVMELNTKEAESNKDEKEKKAFGRTPDGTVFTVPPTHDMVSQLLSPTEPKNLSDIVILAILALHVFALYILPSSAKVPFFAVVFLFWRACYNGGIGILLKLQSDDKRLTTWAKRSGIFEDPSTGKNPHPKLYKLLKREMETKVTKDYHFDKAPLEYNTWLTFRRLVDLILMSDFVSYCCFAIACGGRPEGENPFITIARWIGGFALILFNLWVKLDAHRVVKDFAWYWGDFFYLIDQELTFDGVFEMAPHPMYSVGYAGYYGISLCAASYKVLFISIVAHAAQFAFLALVENPHIEKTYNPPPPPRKRTISGQQERPKSMGREHEQIDELHADNYQSFAPADQPSQVHNLLGFKNIDFHRVTDISVLSLQVYIFLLATLTPSTAGYQAFFVGNALVWRLWYTFGIGYFLDRQSKKKKWTRHFIKYGDSIQEAWRQWKGMYHLSMTMCYASFVAAAWKTYTLPPDWRGDLATLRHVLGAGLIALQMWTAFSIYESLGEFGWFFGDFFFDHASKLTYSGIYRFLNNPERIIGLAGVWGIAVITWSRSIFFLALVSHILSLLFIQLVERPHMQKLYGQSIREESGISKTINRSLPQVRQWRGSVDKYLTEGVDVLEDFIESIRPKVAVGVKTFVKDTTTLFKRPARVSITLLAPDLAGYDPKDYSIEIEGKTSSSPTFDRQSGREGKYARSAARNAEHKTLVFEYGAPIKVRWRAPTNHSKKDWIGLYMVADNASREVTKVASQGRWVATNRGAYDSLIAEKGILVSDNVVTDSDSNKRYLTGEMEFTGDKLWWTTGVFEFRYHHDGKHNVMAISLPFEVKISKFDEEDVEVDSNGLIRGAVEQALLPLVQNCLDRDPDIAPDDVEEDFASAIERDSKYAKRVVFAVHQMFGIEFAPEVVQADGNVRNLAWRICNAKRVLAPYSMSSPKGSTTPTESKF